MRFAALAVSAALLAVGGSALAVGLQAPVCPPLAICGAAAGLFGLCLFALTVE